MKKMLIMALVLLAVFVIQAKAQDFLALRDAQFTSEVISQIARNNSLVRGPSFNFTSSPFNLPVGAERFYEDVPWEKDFTEFISAGSYTNLDSLVVLTSSPEHFTISFPNPANPRYIRFVPRPDHWYGSELMAVSVYEKYAGGAHSEPYTAVLRINVTSVPDAPVFHDLPVANTFYVDEDNEITINFQDYITCIDSAPTNFDLFVTQTQLIFPYSVNYSQSPGSNGHLVTFRPIQDFSGTVNFIITAVDRQSNGYTPVTITLVVRPENDPPVITSHLPVANSITIDQNTNVNFSANVTDPDNDPLTHEWSLSGIFNGVPFTNVVSTTGSLSYLFDIPGTYTLTYTVSDGMETASFTWTITVRPIGPIFDPWGATYDHGITVTLTPPPGFEGASIYYTTNGADPTTSSTLYTQPIAIDPLSNVEHIVTIKAFFAYPGFPNSQIVSSTYRITGRVADPVFNPIGGLYYSQTSVDITCPNLGATIYYTTDGSDPIPGNPGTQIHLSPIVIPTMSSMTIKAIAMRDGWHPSNIVTYFYNVTGVVSIVTHTMNPAPPAAGEYLTYEPASSVPVTIDNVVLNPGTATLYYTLNNTIPSPSNPNAMIYHNGDIIHLTTATWIIIRAYNTDWQPSATYSYYYDIRSRGSILPFDNGTVFDPAPGFDTNAHYVSISTSTNPAGGTIYYTTDGTDPTNNPALLYTGPILVSQTTVIKAIAYFPVINHSIVYSGTFTITGRVDTPVFDPTPNSYPGPINVSISTTLPGTTIYYTLNGADPLPTNISPDSFEYTNAIPLPVGQHHIRARAYKANWEPSLIRDGYYSIGVLPAPTFNLPAGTYQDPIVVRLAVPSVSDVSIHYTTDGSDPTIASTFYDDSIGIPVAAETAVTIKAIAWKAGWLTSAISGRTYNVTGTLVAPVFNPGGGQYAAATDVTITTTSPGAYIKYTLDGSDPTETFGILYSGPVNIAQTSTLKARAFRDGWRESTVTSADYTIFGIVGNPVFVPGAGTYTNPVNVYISVNPPDAEVYYTTDGSVPSAVNGTLYVTGTPINVANTTLIRAIAIKTGWNSSAVVSAQYIITGTVEAPSFLPIPGEYASAQDVTITTATPGATIVYTTDGSTPTQINGLVYAGPIHIASNTTLKAFAFLPGWNDSPITTGLYLINGQVSTPLISPAGGYYGSPQTVSITAFPADATIIYTLDGSVPALGNGMVYAGSFAVDTHTMVKAIAYKANWQDSGIASAEYFFTVANPVFSLASGSYPDAQVLSITAPTPGSSIRYTTDGSDPSDVNGILYAGPINIVANTNIKAIAFMAGWNNSSIVAAQYIINGSIATPVLSLPSGDYYSEQVLTITTYPSDATVYYTTDGSEPSDVNGDLYIAPINITGNTVVKARAYRANWLPSPVATGTYDLWVNPLTFMPPQGLYSSAQNVVIATNTPGTTIYYTTDGTDPSMLTGTLYAGAINIASTTQIRAIAYRPNWHPTPIAISDYVINIPVPVVAAPVFSIPAGVYAAPQVVGISVATPGATIRYTTDGTDPSLVNGMDYTGLIDVPVSTQIRAYAYLAGYADSPIVMSNYIIILPVQTVATPVFTPVAGVYNNSVDVTISTTTPGATIYFTTDGSEPSDVNGTVYAGPITITATTTIKAIAYKAGWDHSLISNASYVIFIPVQTVETPMLFPAPGTYTFAQSVTIATTTPGSLIMYTTDGSDPTLSNGSVYLAPIDIGLNTTLTIKAIAFKDGWNNSQMAAGTYIITGTVSPVVFTPMGGTYTESQTVVLTCPTPESTIRYTLDGSEPNSGSPLYTTGIVLPGNSVTTVKAKAYKAGWTASATGTEVYNITGQVAINAPVFSVPAGTYTTAQIVSISGSYIPADATIHYTTDGTDPDESSPVYSGAINVPLNTTMTIKLRGYRGNWIPSIIYTATYNVTGQVSLASPLFTPAAGIYQTAQTITLDQTTVPAGAILRYTLDGSEPTEISPAYVNPIVLPLNSSTTVKVKGYKADWIPSATAEATYLITGQVSYLSPVFTPNPGVYQTAQTISINAVTPADAVIRYTLDGSEPTEASPEYSTAFSLPLNSSLTIKTKAFKANWTPSVTHTGFYTTTGNVTIQLPVFSPAPGLYTSPQMVSINTNTAPAGATLRYTLDGSDPHAGSPIYSGAIPVNTGQTLNIRVRAFADNWLPSDIYSGLYTVTGQVSLADPVFTPAAGIYTSAQVVTLNTISTPAGATLRYTLDGSEPTITSAIYTTGIALNSSTTIKVKAFLTDWIPSVTYTAAYTITGQVAINAPVFSVPAGTYTTAQIVSISGSYIPADATIHYTTDGTDPDESSPVYGGAINVPLNTTMTIKLRGYRANWIPSIIYTATYNVTGQVSLASPLFTPAAGIYQTAQTITLDQTTVPAGAILRYTLDGTEPTEISPAYVNPIVLPLNSSTTVKVKGYKADWIPSATAEATYLITGQVSYLSPVFTPNPGVYQTAQTISINAVTPADAVIRYTLDGSEPTEASPVYTTAFSLPLNSSLTIKTKAFKANWTPSVTHTGFYTTTGNVTIQLPVFSPTPGLYTSPQMVSISTNTAPAGATLRYTLDGSDPHAGSPIYSGAIPVNTGQTLNIRVRAFADNWLPSDIYSGLYTVTGQVSLADPVFTPAAGIYTSAQVVTLNTISTPAGATLRYTLDGSEPTITSAIYTTGIALNSSTTIKVKAFLTDWIPSVTYTAAYTITGQVAINAPVFSVPAGTYTTAQSISISGALTPLDAVVRYTTNGSDPTESSAIFSSPVNIPLNSTMTIKVRAYREGWVPSPIYTASYTVTGQITLPGTMFTPAAGIYQTAQTVTLNNATNPTGATLRYTLDGSDPTEQSAAYLSPIQLPLNSTTTIKVKAFKTDWIPSVTVSATYQITGQISFTPPVFTPVAGLYYTAQSVTIGNPIPNDAVVRYTTDGTDPTETSAIYTAAINLNTGTTVLKVRAFKTNWTPSAVQSATYQITGQVSMTTPFFSPAPGTYTTAQNVTINTVTVPVGATIRYTTDGTVPTATSPIYAGAINVPLNTSVTFRARAFLENWLPSDIAMATYNVTGQVSMSDPVFSPAPGIYNAITSVSLNSLTSPAGATLYYTTDGSDPTTASSIYSSAIILGLNSTTTIKVRAYKTDWLPSSVYSGTYIVTGRLNFTAAQLFTPPAGTYTTAQDVAITAVTTPVNGTIRYTTDGSEPVITSPVYSTPINVPLNTLGFTIKAKAFYPDWLPSETITAVYNVTGQVELASSPFSPIPGTYTTAQTVTVSAPQLPGTAIIRYTLDGTEPTLESPAYTNSLVMPLNTVTTLKIKGFADQWVSSETITGIYNVTGTIAAPTFSRNSGIYPEAFDLEISCATPGVSIRYTLDGTEPSEASALYTEPINIPALTQNLTLKAKAYKTDWIPSSVSSATYSVLLLPLDIRAYSYSGYIRVLWNSPIALKSLDGFNLYRRSSGESSYTKVNSAPITTFDNGFYYYDDYVVQVNATYQYYVTAIYSGMESGGSETTSIEYQSQDLEINSSTHAYPNPAVTSCKIKLVLSRNDNVQVSVTVFDFAGKKIRTLIVPTTNTNMIEIPWDLKNTSGTKVARGTYFARIVASDGVNKVEKTIKIAVK